MICYVCLCHTGSVKGFFYCRNNHLGSIKSEYISVYKTTQKFHSSISSLLQSHICQLVCVLETKYFPITFVNCLLDFFNVFLFVLLKFKFQVGLKRRFSLITNRHVGSNPVKRFEEFLFLVSCIGIKSKPVTIFQKSF